MEKEINIKKLTDTAQALVVGVRGLLAMDESNPTCNERFAALGIPQTFETRRAYRELLLTAPGLGKYISGVILYDETIRQAKKDGTPFLKIITDAGIIPGIKVDTGAKDMEGHMGEKLTEGLDGLPARLTEYAQMGARFAKWRAVITIGAGIPSQDCIKANAQALARYAKLCQEAGLVPIIEPEVLMAGGHTLEKCREVTKQVLQEVFNQLNFERVLLEGIILKPNMVLPGLACSAQETVDQVADATVECLLNNVPAIVPGIAFLSGGQSDELASARLNAMNERFKSKMPWALTFSFSRALQRSALEIWRGDDKNWVAAQRALLSCAERNSAARRGEYSAALYPLRFKPIYQYRLWGGRHLANLLSAPLPGDGPIGEAWILSDRDGHESIVAEGPFKGQSLTELLARSPEAMLGKFAPRFSHFPLLLKFLDAREMLSVQVHPSDQDTKYLPPGGLGKTEAWIVLETGSKSQVYAGLKPETTADDLRQSIANKTVSDRLAGFKPKVGDGIFLPAGTVHSFGDLVVFEVEENSDTTFRLYDWDHIDPKTGKQRSLQVEKAMACVDFNQGAISPVAPITEATEPALREKLFFCEQFGLWRHSGSATFTVGVAETPRALVCLAGDGQLEYNGADYAFKKGDALLLPSAVGACLCRPHGKIIMLEISL